MENFRKIEAIFPKTALKTALKIVIWVFFRVFQKNFQREYAYHFYIKSPPPGDLFWCLHQAQCDFAICEVAVWNSSNQVTSYEA